VSDEFFDRPAPSEDPAPPRPEQPPWAGPPSGTLPGVAPVELVLASNERAAVSIGRCSAYPTGFEVEVRVLVRGAEAQELDPSLNGVYRLPGGRTTFETMLRFGIEFSDGRKATNVGGRGPAGSGEPPNPVLWGMGGGGGGGRWRQDFWVWPLPPAGPVRFVCEWPAAGISMTRQSIDAQVLLDAAARARSVFPTEPASDDGCRWSSSGFTVVRADDPCE